MGSAKRRPPSSGPLLILFIVITLVSVTSGIIYYNYQKKSLLNEKQLELSAISYLKIHQISQWRAERIGDGKFLGGNILFVSKILEYLQNKSNVKLKSDVIQSLKSLTENHDYKSVILLDKSGKVIIAYPGEDTVMGDRMKSVLSFILKQHTVFLTDLHKSEQANFVHLDMIVPLINQSQNDTLVVGLLALRIDPEQVLYPLIKSWPASSRSAETLLVRKDGDEIVYLNKLKNLNNSELVLKKPVSSKNLPAAMATRGETSVIDGIDYRNVHVVASMNKVPETSWYMVAKMDRDEILSELTSQMKMISAIIILIIITAGSLLGFLFRNQRVAYYREKYENELNRLALVKHFDYILKYANDIILLIDEDWNIVEVNDCALDYYQYTRDELIGMKVENIRTPETRLDLSENLHMLDEKGYSTFETVHMRKDKTTFPVELSSRVVMIEGRKYYQSIGRDITDRKRIEKTLKESEDKFRKIFEESPFSMLMTDKDFAILRANSTFCKFIGYTEDELKTNTFRFFTHPEYIEKDEISLLKLTAGEIPIYHIEKRYVRKDSSFIWGSTT
ncbi:MAG TPA: PAS domain S-box protein, partial [Bacteroidales bacterium]|nr:PAS domain S-box protein [Bacteroidales bacterium]